MINIPGRSSVRPTVLALAVVALVVAGAATVVAHTVPTAFALAASVEDEGAGCAVSLPGSTPSTSKLPDPFKKIDGTRITSKSDWRCRREEIKKQAEATVYGTKPAKPASVSGTVSRTGITVNVSDNGRSSSFSASVSVPSTGSAPYPAVIVVGGLGADTATITGSGVAIINYDPLAVGKEGTARNNKQGAFYSVYGATSGTGLLAAWAWGVSRIIDVIEQSGGSVLRADALGVTGCSRYGKGAFVIGAFDQRIALTMPIESGSGGAPILRGIPGESGSQPLSSAYSEQPWLGDAFGSYTGNPAALPVDTHEMVAMVAPRGLFIMENPRIDWLAARSGSVAALAGAEVYKALGAGENITYWSDIQDGTHCAVRSEWRTPLQQNLQKYLLKTGNAAGTFRISSLKAGNLADWRDWTTPVLSDSPSSPPPSSPPPSSPPPSSPPPSSPPPSSPPPAGVCAAAYKTVNSWQGGFQGEVTVTAGGSAINGWTAGWTLASGQTITQLWSGTLTVSGSAVTVKNVSYNGSLAAGASTTFGFLANGSPSAPTLTCASP
ncbi:cellulose-binding domain-containing protein [Hamadaea sp. NPDC051192]|uniref:cellulose-binding domain-containing protein n=1 Tax=Hamadaea sp. NPDC051192 TaxID=3154940 RepID=UPI00343CEE21